MPELPEVETTLNGLSPYLLNNTITNIVVRNEKLRKPITPYFVNQLKKSRIISLERKAKYIITKIDSGYWISHLGMSGSLSFHQANTPYLKHDHLIIDFDKGPQLRYNDPRRFGFHEYTPCLSDLKYLNHLGLEPLDDAFNPNDFYRLTSQSNRPIKSFIMDQKIVVGVGNIYATEALFLSQINPETPARNISKAQLKTLIDHIKECLETAIKLGGTTLRDFVNPDKKSGYFQQTLKVYGKLNQPCPICKTTIQSVKINQRASAFCPLCQPL